VLLAGRWFGMLVSYLRDGERAYETYWPTGRAAEVMALSYGLLDMTVYGRQETWEDSPQPPSGSVQRPVISPGPGRPFAPAPAWS
jgi:predicted dithiol-disulfide oxidoreductase (DUF899 family)